MPGLILADDAQMCAGLLRTLAARWRDRVETGHIGGSSTSEVASFVQALEEAAVRLDEVALAPVAAIGQLLNEREERLRLLVDGVEVYAILGLDVGGHVTSWNKGAQRLTGYADGEVLGHHFGMFFGADDVAADEPGRLLQAAATTGPQELEGWRLRKDGTRFWAHVAFTALRDPAGSLRGFGEVTYDASRRHDAILTLRRAEELFRVFTEGIQDYAICVLDPDGRVLTWNSGAERIVGYSAAEIVGKPFSTVHPTESVAAEGPRRELEIAAASGRYEDNGWRVRKDGGRFWANVVIVPVRDAAGALIGFAKVTQDLTERRASQEAAERRSAELEAANNELETFSYSVAHELRTPARTANNFAQMLEESAGARLDEGERKLLRAIRSSTRRVGDLIEGLLALAQVTKAPVSRAPVDLAEIARDVVSAVEAAEPGRVVEWAIPDTLPAEGDPQLLLTVMENLVANAWKFTRQTPDARIEVGGTLDGGRRVWFVRDNGVGFDMAHAANLFQPFERLHGAAEFEGTGVGLASVQRIARRHGGDVWAESSPGKGATFWFTLESPQRPPTGSSKC